MTNTLAARLSHTGSLRRARDLAVITAVALFSGLPSADAAGSNETPVAEPVSPGGPATLRLMNTEQYHNAIATIFGADIKNQARIPSPRRTEGLAALGGAAAAITPGTLDIFDTAAHAVAAQVVDEAHREALIPCKPADVRQPDDTCARAFFTSAGRLLFRRPLRSTELDTYVADARQGSLQFQSFYAGLEASLAGMLIAPQFIYFVEHAEPDPAQPGAFRLDGLSKAARLSLLVWNSPPDAELLRAAESGELHTQQGLDRQIERLFASPHMVDGVRAFFEDMLALEAFDDIAKDPAIYLAYTAKVATDAREQMLRIIVDHLVERNADYRDLFTTRRIFLTQSLGSVYRVPVAAAGALEWMPYELPADDPRSGLLTQVGFLSVEAHPGRSSATRRGKGLREIFMCQKVPDPPPNVDFSAVEKPNPNLHTMRDRLDFHRTNPICAGCHKITDPIGLALENFDGAGQYRSTESGVTIDASGSLDGTAFQDAKGLGAAVRNNPAIPACLVQRLYQYGVGRTASADEKPVLSYFGSRFAQAQFSFPALLRVLATSNAFYRVSQSGTTQLQSTQARN